MRYIFFFLISLVFTMTSAAPSYASESLSLAKIIKRPTLAWPVDCQIGEDCWIYNYVDMGLNDEVGTDLTCNNRSYDNHKGTDIGIATEAELNKGVDVLASADGIVKRTRDGEAENWWSDDELKAIQEQRRECGNAIIIDHGDGLETIYCHLKKGSVTVQKGQKVKAGQKIGQIGLSGFTEFPHLHFGALLDGTILDPFTGISNIKTCGNHKNRLWDKNVTAQYEPLILHKGGFTETIPTIDDVYKADFNQETFEQGIENFIFWFNYLGAREGDEISIEILDPNLKPFAKRSIVQDKTRATQLYYTGKRIRGDAMQAGVYLATVTIKRALNNSGNQDVTELDNNKGQDIREWTLNRSLTVLP